jgi:hypothetical protein
LLLHGEHDVAVSVVEVVQRSPPFCGRQVLERGDDDAQLVELRPV